MIAGMVGFFERFARACDELAVRVDRFGNWLERQADELETMVELRAARRRRA